MTDQFGGSFRACLIVGAIGFRLLIDMRSSRLSSAALVLAAIAYLTALTAFFRGITLQSEFYQLLLAQGLLLGGHLLLAMSMGLHARYVLLDAEGVLPKRSLKKKAEKKKAKTDKAGRAATRGVTAKASSASGASDAADSDPGAEEPDGEQSGDTWVAIDPPHGSSQPILKRMAPAETSAVPSLSQKIVVPGAESSSDSGTDDSKLSKADRKALKKKLIDERLKRERKAANW